MQAAVRATLFHVASSKQNNWHYPHRWCKHNRDIANKTTTYKPGPGLPLDIVMKLKPIFEELSNEKLLKKCLHGLTQNQNESFNATIWERLPKTRYVSRTQLEFGVYDAVAIFNIGRKASILIFEMLDMIPGKYTVEGCKIISQKDYQIQLIKILKVLKNVERLFEANQNKKMIKMTKKMGKHMHQVHFSNCDSFLFCFYLDGFI